eukprot:CAMPEP_0174903934 /NCGR_PEP_ID=MMETSP0167-20121228/46244_1 /TAXON_ID=38298 /ORGANISM="Rhodella maculata, Strain CCMP736" /LENGTH=259 /DNA_ID=CAMNT_0016146409 /DNA_START=153 /DNA_END=933 /DNA_ORIENTATION=+
MFAPPPRPEIRPCLKGRRPRLSLSNFAKPTPSSTSPLNFSLPMSRVTPVFKPTNNDDPSRQRLQAPDIICHHTQPQSEHAAPTLPEAFHGSTHILRPHHGSLPPSHIAPRFHPQAHSACTTQHIQFKLETLLSSLQSRIDGVISYARRGQDAEFRAVQQRVSKLNSFLAQMAGSLAAPAAAAAAAAALPPPLPAVMEEEVEAAGMAEGAEGTEVTGETGAESAYEESVSNSESEEESEGEKSDEGEEDDETPGHVQGED